MSKRISDPKTGEKFNDWLRENSLMPENLDLIDIEAEFGNDLTFDEAVGLAMQSSQDFGNLNRVLLVIQSPNR